MKVLGPIEPHPPRGIKYMLGNESWMHPDKRSQARLICEEWGNLGPMELDPSIQANEAGFRVRLTDIPAPLGARGFAEIDGIYYWTDTSVWDQIRQEQDTMAGGSGEG